MRLVHASIDARRTLLTLSLHWSAVRGLLGSAALTAFTTCVQTSGFQPFPLWCVDLLARRTLRAAVVWTADQWIFLVAIRVKRAEVTERDKIPPANFPWGKFRWGGKIIPAFPIRALRTDRPPISGVMASILPPW